MDAYRALATKALHRQIVDVAAPDAWFLKGGLTAAAAMTALAGRSFEAARRIGKVLFLDTSGGGPVVGLRFGMTGRLLVDGAAGVDQLLYSSVRDEPRWDRFVVVFSGGGDLRVRDPRRLGGVFLDPPEDRLGPDAATITPSQLRSALRGSAVALKARLLDQRQIAGVGNLIADETLWRAGLDPARPAAALSPPELRRLAKHLVATIAMLQARGGSHTGDFLPERHPGGVCPRDGEALLKATIGGRTTWWCPRHQR